MQILKNSVTLIILLCICLSLVSCNSVGDDTIDSTNTESGSNSVYISDVQKDTTDITEVIDNAGQVDPDRDNLYTDENYDYEYAENPWDSEGAKQPDEYTWEEFESLDSIYQIAFQNWFGSIDEFDKWMIKAQGENMEENHPWNTEGAKQPDEYTWEEFEALDSAYQIAFQNWFGSFEEFDKWMIKAQYGNVEEDYPWNIEGGKQPDEYTWEEFEALDSAYQIAFQNWFGSFEEFDQWMIKTQGENIEENYPWNVEGAKQPDEYTWEEFEMLEPADQIAFQNWFGSIEEFDKWLVANRR